METAPRWCSRVRERGAVFPTAGASTFRRALRNPSAPVGMTRSSRAPGVLRLAAPFVIPAFGGDDG